MKQEINAKSMPLDRFFSCTSTGRELGRGLTYRALKGRYNLRSLSNPASLCKGGDRTRGPSWKMGKPATPHVGLRAQPASGRCHRIFRSRDQATHEYSVNPYAKCTHIA